MMRKANKPKSVTSRDVAALAGVSLMTVSRPLRTLERVSTAARERVESTARQLNYIPDLATGTLASQRSGHVAALLPTLRHTGFGHVSALQKAGLSTDIRAISGHTPIGIKDTANGLSELLNHFPAIDALACASDMTAKGALHTCQRRGCKMPEPIGTQPKQSHRDLGFQIFHRQSTSGAATTNLNLSLANDELLMVGVSSRQ